MPFSVVYIGTYFPFQKRLNYLGLSSLPTPKRVLCRKTTFQRTGVLKRLTRLVKKAHLRRFLTSEIYDPLRFAQRPNSALGYALHLFQSFPAQPMFSIKRRFRTTSLSLFVHIRPRTAHGKASQGILRLAGRNTAVQSAARVLTPRRTENRIVFPLPAPSECSQTVAVFSLHQNSPPPYGKRAVGFSFLLAAGQSLSMGRPWPQSAGNNGSSRSPG